MLPGYVSDAYVLNHRAQLPRFGVRISGGRRKNGHVRVANHTIIEYEISAGLSKGFERGCC